MTSSRIRQLHTGMSFQYFRGEGLLWHAGYEATGINITVYMCKLNINQYISVIRASISVKLTTYGTSSDFDASSVWPMMTSSNGHIFRVTGHLCGEFTCPRWIPRTKASDAELWCFLWINVRVNNREAGDLGRHRANYDVIVMQNIKTARVYAYSKVCHHITGVFEVHHLAY